MLSERCLQERQPEPVSDSEPWLELEPESDSEPDSESRSSLKLDSSSELWLLEQPAG